MLHILTLTVNSFLTTVDVTIIIILFFVIARILFVSSTASFAVGQDVALYSATKAFTSSLAKVKTKQNNTNFLYCLPPPPTTTTTTTTTTNFIFSINLNALFPLAFEVVAEGINQRQYFCHVGLSRSCENKICGKSRRHRRTRIHAAWTHHVS